jgi:hypothetical protein
MGRRGPRRGPPTKVVRVLAEDAALIEGAYPYETQWSLALHRMLEERDPFERKAKDKGEFG